jgi:hypothetical protein
MGCFHDFKLHIVINDKDELLSFCVTQANVDDREPLKMKVFSKKYLKNFMLIKRISFIDKLPS